MNMSQNNVSKQNKVDPEPAGTSDSEETVVSVEDLTVHFKSSSGVIRNLFSTPDTVRAVDGVDLNIKNNETVVLIGESGCGKTTLGKTIIGGQEPTGGSIKYRGQDIWKAKFFEGDVQIPYKTIRRSLQMIHQDPGDSLNPNKTIRSILARPLVKWAPHLDAEERLSRIYGLLQRVGMAPPETYTERYPHQLSGGEQQRVALSRALLMNPALIMADEILSPLDVSLRIDMMDLLIDLQSDFDTAFLLISHNLSNARYIAEKMDGRIGIMYLGEIVEMGPPSEVLTNPQHPYTAALKWATPKLDPTTERVAEPPIRDIDVPDPVDPPAGCRFHTRCPEAREICVKQHPQSQDIGGEDTNHQSACFRAFGDDHEYWDSSSIVD